MVPLLLAGSRRVAGGSSLRWAQRTPSGLRSPLPTPTLLRSLSPRDQEGLSSSNASLPDVLPPLPRRSLLRSHPVFPQQVLPSPVVEGLGFRFVVFTGLARRSIPAARQVAFRPLVGFVRRHRAGVAPLRVSSASCFWLLSCWGFHPLGCAVFLLDTASRQGSLLHPALEHRTG